MKHSSTKRTLLASVLALVLSFSMLIGSTFAWFTDSVSSGTNTIVAGNLDIELYHSNKIDNEEKVAVDTVLFDDVDPSLWEPNALAYEIFNVKNEGSLALKYKLTLNALNETVVDGISFASMLRVAVIEDDNYTYSRDSIVSDANLVWNDLATFSLEGELEKNENKIYGIVIWWNPTANDNIFNMKNDKNGETVKIDVGVQLVATQLNVESDSFNPDYDADVEYPYISIPSKVSVGTSTEEVELSVNGMDVTVPAAVINALPSTVTNISLAYTTPIANAANSSLTFESVELLDQNGNVIDLAGNGAAPLTVTLLVPTTFAANDFVFIYHDGELIGTGTVNANGELTYTTNHFCEVVISKELQGDSIEVSTADELAQLSNANLAGKTIKLLNDITLAEETSLPAGVIFDGNGKQITGTIFACGDITFVGHTKATLFKAPFNGSTITVNPGACLEVTGSGRVTIGWGNTFNIMGTIANAKTADKTTVQPSLIVPGISFAGNGVTLNVKDAYIVSGTAQATSAKSAYDKFAFNFENSIFESKNNFSFINGAGATSAVVLNAKDSVLDFEKNLDLANTTCNTTIDNSIVTVGSSLRNEGKLTVKNGSELTVKVQAQASGGHGVNSGELIVDNATVTITAANTASAMDGVGTGSIVLKNGANATINYYKNIAVTVDETSSLTGTDCSAN